MSEQHEVREPAGASSGWGRAIVGVAAGGLGAVAMVWLVMSIADGDVVGALVGAGLLAVTVGLAGLGMSVVAQGDWRRRQSQQTAAMSLAAQRLSKELAELRQQVSHMVGVARAIEKWVMLSQEGRAILARLPEQQALRDAVARALSLQQWQEAERLIAAMQQQFGLADEAEALRTRMEDVKSEFAQRRSQKREQLLGRWQQAFAEEKVAACLELLGQMQQILGEQELADLRGQLAQMDHQVQISLRDQFAELVKAKQWVDAVEQADEILKRYPQAAMAADIRKIYEQLAERARGQSAEALKFPH